MAVAYETGAAATNVTTIDLSGVSSDAFVVLAWADNLNPPTGTPDGLGGVWTTLEEITSPTQNGTTVALFSGAAVDPSWTDSVNVTWAAFTGVGSYDSSTLDFVNVDVDPPSHTSAQVIAAGVDMWATTGGNSGADGTWAAPSGYSNGFTRDLTSGSCGVASRDGTDSDTENPGIWTASGSGTRGHGTTIALIAAAAAGFSGYWGLRVASWVMAGTSGLWLPDTASDLLDMV